jgi:hypothetical protein
MRHPVAHAPPGLPACGVRRDAERIGHPGAARVQGRSPTAGGRCPGRRAGGPTRRRHARAAHCPAAERLACRRSVAACARFGRGPGSSTLGMPELRRVRRSRGGHRRSAPGAKRQGADGRRSGPCAARRAALKTYGASSPAPEHPSRRAARAGSWHRARGESQPTGSVGRRAATDCWFCPVLQPGAVVRYNTNDAALRVDALDQAWQVAPIDKDPGALGEGHRRRSGTRVGDRRAVIEWARGESPVPTERFGLPAELVSLTQELALDVVREEG